jgi:hypothetical protein
MRTKFTVSRYWQRLLESTTLGYEFVAVVEQEAEHLPKQRWEKLMLPASGDNERLSLALNSITEIAKSSPFKDLANINSVRAALDDPNHVWTI